MSHKNSDFQTLWNLHISAFITILASYFRQVSFMISWFNQFIFSKRFSLQVFFCFFCSLWTLASIKSTWLKTFMSESIVQFKIPDNQCQNLNWKLRSVREEYVLEISTRCLAISTEFLLAFYWSNLQMQVFWSHCRALKIIVWLVIS